MFRNELALIDYITLLGNFDDSYMVTGFYSAGHFDMYNIGTSALETEEKISTAREILMPQPKPLSHMILYSVRLVVF